MARRHAIEFHSELRHSHQIVIRNEKAICAAAAGDVETNVIASEL
jgi:hypothetical protein